MACDELARGERLCHAVEGARPFHHLLPRGGRAYCSFEEFGRVQNPMERARMPHSVEGWKALELPDEGRLFDDSKGGSRGLAGPD